MILTNASVRTILMNNIIRTSNIDSMKQHISFALDYFDMSRCKSISNWLRKNIIRISIGGKCKSPFSMMKRMMSDLNLKQSKNSQFELHRVYIQITLCKLIGTVQVIEVIYQTIRKNTNAYDFNKIDYNAKHLKTAVRKTFKNNDILISIYNILGQFFKKEKDIDVFIAELWHESTNIFPDSDCAVPLCDILIQSLCEIYVKCTEKEKA